MIPFLTRDQFDVSFREIVYRPDKTKIQAYGVGEIVNTHDQAGKVRDLKRLKNKIGRKKARKIHQTAAKNGQILDRLLLDYFCLKGKGLSPPPYPMIRSLQDFLSEAGQCIAQEFFLVGEVAPGIPVFGFADILFRDKAGKLVLTDWKCATHEKKYTTRPCLQIAAYTHLLWLRHRLVVDKACVAIAMTDGSPAQVIELDREELANWVAAFRAMAIRFSAESPI